MTGNSIVSNGSLAALAAVRRPDRLAEAVKLLAAIGDPKALTALEAGQRMSLGLEASTSDFTLFANRYVGGKGPVVYVAQCWQGAFYVRLKGFNFGRHIYQNAQLV